MEKLYDFWKLIRTLKDYKKIQKCRERKKAMTRGGQLRCRDENASLSENPNECHDGHQNINIIDNISQNRKLLNIDLVQVKHEIFSEYVDDDDEDLFV